MDCHVGRCQVTLVSDSQATRELIVTCLRELEVAGGFVPVSMITS